MAIEVATKIQEEMCEITGVFHSGEISEQQRNRAANVSFLFPLDLIYV